MKLTVVISIANNNAAGTDRQTAVGIAVYDRTEGVCVFYNQTVTETQNTTYAAYEALAEYFRWLVDDCGYRSKLDLEFVCKDKNTNSSLMKLCKTYYTLRNTWTAMVAGLARKGYRGADLRREKLLLIQWMLTANHKAADEVMVHQRKLVITCLEVLECRFTKGYEMWTVSLSKLWSKDESFNDIRKWVKEEQAKVIQLNGMSHGISGRKWPAKNTSESAS